jgi:hypothetical protein
MDPKKSFESVFIELQKNYLLLNHHVPEARRIARDAEILPIMFDGGGFFALMRDGRVQGYRFDDLENPKIEEDPRIRNTVWFQGTKIYAELEPFVPVPGEDSVTCPHCNGSGVVPNIPPELSDKIVCYCGGLGWIPSENG